MIIDEKPAAIKVSVLFFFIVSVIGAFSDVSCLEITKRALIAGVITYFGTVITVKIINFILITSILSEKQNDSRTEDQEKDTE